MPGGGFSCPGSASTFGISMTSMGLVISGRRCAATASLKGTSFAGWAAQAAIPSDTVRISMWFVMAFISLR